MGQATGNDIMSDRPSPILQRLAERTANFRLRNFRRNLEYPWCRKLLTRFELPRSAHHDAH
jgi:hypothetical protein